MADGEERREVVSDRRPEARLTDAADIVFCSTVRADTVTFGRAASPRITFQGEPDEESGSGSRRTRLPDRVDEDVVYHDIQVDFVIAAKLLLRAPDG
jgi:hypothetical protein